MRSTFDFTTLVRPKSPNTYLVAPDGLCQSARADQPSRVYALTPDALFQRLSSEVGHVRSVTDIRSDAQGRSLSCVAVTPLMRFKDDVDIAVLPGPSAATAQPAIYSRSRVGHSDLGANAKRVQALLARLKDVEKSA